MVTNSGLSIGGRLFTSEHPCITAEVAQAHEGSLGMAHAFIDTAAAAGADAIKFQTHIAHAESTLREPWRVKFSIQDNSRFDYWKRMEFTEDQWLGLKRHADEAGLIFLSSPFSNQAVEMLHRIGVGAWKVASGEINNIPLLEKMIQLRHPIIISSGMSPLTELDSAVSLVKEAGLPVGILQCTSEYPCPPERLGFNQISLLRERYLIPVGFSDHSGEIAAGIAASTLGIFYLEVHLTFHKGMFGPDVASSLTPSELAQLVAGVRLVTKGLANPVNKEEISDSFTSTRRIFGKSIVASRNLAKGHALDITDLAFKKPGDGLSPREAKRILGMRTTRSILADDLITIDILDEHKS
jgi:N,N'-diacetyllegionaminate synthase